MTTPPPKLTVRNCAAKHRYPDELSARAAGMYAIETHRNTDALDAYQCPICHGWHLTRQINGIAITATDPFDTKIVSNAHRRRSHA